MPVIEEHCTLTATGQTTVPKAVRHALGVGFGGQISFRIKDGVITVHALLEEDASDPALAPFLALLEADLAARPAAIIQFSIDATRQIANVDQESPVDLDLPITGRVAS